MKSRFSQLDELGDLSAPAGSRKWAIAVRDELASAIHNAQFSSASVKEMHNLLRKHEAWKVLADDKGNRFVSFEAFCVFRRPFGLGHRVEDIDRIIEERRAAESAQGLAADPEVKPLAEHGNQAGENNSRNRGNNITSVERGTAAEYLVRRLKRDAPDVAERLANGEFKSARAAAIEAGIVKDPTPLTLLKRAWNKASEEERNEFLASLSRS